MSAALFESAVDPYFVITVSFYHLFHIRGVLLHMQRDHTLDFATPAKPRASNGQLRCLPQIPLRMVQIWVAPFRAGERTFAVKLAHSEGRANRCIAAHLFGYCYYSVIKLNVPAQRGGRRFEAIPLIVKLCPSLCRCWLLYCAPAVCF